ncbi:S-layer homology domain-containing protein [Paenibacillus alvei]|uniref:S-layer homology domain-containing protein n=1 Tax=Paenibacillus alvei TaxID=44250 RepID=UPI00028A0009|nr:S-layer homology domain-containing protein [Paenibacillus alvei]EJW16575.1 S-layer-like protein [Paenibacillus alvei DSM 29]MCY7484803.1 S-layer homology domain-containing protein [Paenibacillus alvei]MCY9541687.1 S-layer homology domain-containing protein [Paenibacillus alvei]MCY9704173.1 S-layer homology domain-containing protein [Paenibacillus alvei]MCY9736900.1 S-layer homology domain-containing protein [Paenibacillus alvei]
MRYILLRPLSFWLVAILLFSSMLQTVPNLAQAEAAVPPFEHQLDSSVGSDPVTLVSQDASQTLLISDMNAPGDSLRNKTDYLALYTSGAGVTNTVYGNEVFVKKYEMAIVVNSHSVVEAVYGPDADPPVSWDDDIRISIPEEGYIVLSGGTTWDSSIHQKPLFHHYGVGDRIRLMRGGKEVTAADFRNQKPDPEPELKPELHLVTPSESKVTVPIIEVKGYVANYRENQNIQVTIGGKQASITANGSFMLPVYLIAGVNSITVRLMKGDLELAMSQLTVTYDRSGQGSDYIEVEAAPIDVTIEIQGPRHKIDVVDADLSQHGNVVALFTRDYGSTLVIPQYNVAVQVDEHNRVLRVVNPSINGKPPVWTGPTTLEIPDGGYVLTAQDDSYASNYIKRYLAVHFKAGDQIKLRKNGEVVSVRDVMSGNGAIARLVLDNDSMYTVTDQQTIITGRIMNMDNPAATVLFMNGKQETFGADGSFSVPVPLNSGTNYVDIALMKNGKEQDKRHIVVFNRPGFSPKKEVILWVDQAANARKFQSSEQVQAFLKKAKDIGVTTIIFDVKGVEGFASYKKNDLTGRPYVSEIKAPEKSGSNPNLDLLQEFVTHGHALGLKVHASVNVFAEGSIAHNEYAVLDQHLDWEERVYVPENNGEIKRLRESAKKGLVAFVNPSNDEGRAYQLKTFEEVIKNYDVDGVVHDRGRYDNETADFSDITRIKFEQFLQAKGKRLQNWPNDIYRYEQNTRIYGPLIQEWWEFRSQTIKSFFGEVKALVDSYEASTGRTIQVSSYVGSWYETYYLNGVNWGSANFRYDERLGLPDQSVYTPEYYGTGYIEYLDFLMIGAYQTTSKEVKKYITLGNIVTNGEVPLYAGISLVNVQSPSMQREAFQAGLSTTNGLMLFDASQINWPIAAAALRDEEYVKDYQLGISLPNSPNSFLEGNYYNVNRVEGNVNVLTDAFGYSTGTNQFGVEVVVDASGQVTKVVNRNQAIQWNWAVPEQNNSIIPQGGFVITTVDPSGTSTLRQLVANAYDTGNSVRAAVLSGLKDDEGRKTSSREIWVEGQVEVLGTGKSEVYLNGQAATVGASGTFKSVIPLSVGHNSVTVQVFVDKIKTNSRTIDITRTGSGDTDSNSGDSSQSGGAVVSQQPAAPAKPERLSISHRQNKDGQFVTAARINLAPMQAEIEQFKKQSSIAPIFIYSISNVQDVLDISLPVKGVLQAAEEFSQLKPNIRVVSSFGQLTLPLHALRSALGSSSVQKTEELQIQIRTLTKEQDKELQKRLAVEGALQLGSPFEIEFAVKDGDRKQATTLSRVRAQFDYKLPAAMSDKNRVTAISYDRHLGRISFLPALFEFGDGGLEASLQLSETGIFTIAEVQSPIFADIQGHWAETDILLLASKLIVKGTSDTRFDPGDPLTRAQFTTMLVRALGMKEKTDVSPFSDIQPKDWYAGAIGAAVEQGLIQGDNGRFRPNDRITREQISMLLARAAELVGMNLAEGNTEELLRAFKDRSKIASWAKDAVAKVVNNGLMEGRSFDHFVPNGTATRAEAVVVLKRLLQQAGYLNR